MTTTRARAWGGFVSLPENESALSACRWLARWVREGDRPPFAVLYVHGDVGSGKTQLVTALAAHVPGTVVVTAWEFAKAEYERDFLAPPLVVVEGVHQLPKEAVERFVTLLDDRARRRRATAVTAVGSPLDLTGFSRRLTTRLAGGLTVALDPPGPDSRATLAQFFSSTATNRMSRAHAADFVAVTPGGLRELRAAAQRFTTRPGQRPETVRDNGRSIRTALVPTDESHPLHAVTAAVAKAFKVSAADVRGESQIAAVALARQTVAYLGNVVLGLPHREITSFLNRSKSSFVSVHVTVRWKMLRDPALNAVIAKLESDWRAKRQKVVARVSTAKRRGARETDGA
jgi:chromosomal replication initiation ATPase DnaA